jgi:hypothetical protein
MSSFRMIMPTWNSGRLATGTSYSKAPNLAGSWCPDGVPYHERVYLTVDQTQVRGNSGLQRLVQVSERAEATGHKIHIWEAAHSLRAGVVCLTAWWESLAELETVSDTLRGAESQREPGHEDGEEMEPAMQRLLVVVAGPTEFDRTHDYLRIVEVNCLKDPQTAIDNGLELSEKVSSATGVSMTLLRNVTGFSKEMMFLSTYENLAQYESAGHDLQKSPYWLHIRGRYGSVFDGSTLAMNLFRRVGSG